MKDSINGKLISKINIMAISEKNSWYKTACSLEKELKKAREYPEMARRLLSEFGDIMPIDCKSFLDDIVNVRDVIEIIETWDRRTQY